MRWDDCKGLLAVSAQISRRRFQNLTERAVTSICWSNVRPRWRYRRWSTRLKVYRPADYAKNDRILLNSIGVAGCGRPAISRHPVAARQLPFCATTSRADKLQLPVLRTIRYPSLPFMAGSLARNPDDHASVLLANSQDTLACAALGYP